MRTIIAGSRKILHYHLVCQAVKEAGWEITTVISGCAKGVDTLGEQYAVVHEIPVERHPADWNRLGRAAGPLRNREMAQCAEALIAVLYPGSRGTENMIQEARKAGLRVHVKWIEDPSVVSEPTDAADAQVREQLRCQDLLADFNRTPSSQMRRRNLLLTRLLAEVGANCQVETPLYATWGCHTHFGSHVHASVGLTLEDDAEIWIGDHVSLGPNVILTTSRPPRHLEAAESTSPTMLPVRIERNVRIGANAIIMPGVTIAENTVIPPGTIVEGGIAERAGGVKPYI